MLNARAARVLISVSGRDSSADIEKPEITAKVPHDDVPLRRGDQSGQPADDGEDLNRRAFSIGQDGRRGDESGGSVGSRQIG